MTTAVAALAAVSLAVTVLGLARRPLVRRLAARHLAHRPSETALIVLGAMFGAATITAALVVGDSFDASLRDIARTNFGPLDVMVTVTPPADVSRELHHIEDVVAHAGLPHVDGMMTAVTAGATLTLPSANEPDATPKVLPRSCVAEIEFASARHFGPDRSIGGFAAAGSTPTNDAAAVNERTAARLGAGVGDEITVHAVGTSWSARIDRVLPTVGLAGYCDILLAPGTLQTRAGQTAGSATPATRVATPPTGALLISLDGGVFNTDRYAKQVVRQLRALTRDDSKDLRLRTQVSAPKRDVIERATRTGDRLRTIFLGIGGFSIAAGILLLVNLVVMLAEERRRELGVLRALGLRRSGVVTAFVVEGSITAAVAAIVGTALGAALAGLVVAAARGIVADPGSSLRITTHAEWSTLVAAATSGYVVSMGALTIATARISRFDVVAAVRGLTDPAQTRRLRHRATGGAAITVVGVALTWWGFNGTEGIGVLAGPVVAAAGIEQLVAPHRRRPARLMGGVASLVWLLGAFSWWPDQLRGSGIAVFLTLGILSVGAAVVALLALAPALRSITDHLGRFALTARLGLASPLAHLGRTGLVVTMFSLVVFSLGFLATLATTIGTAVEGAPAQISAGFDLVVDVEAASTVSAQVLEQSTGVSRIAPLTRARVEFRTTEFPQGREGRLTGFDDRLLAFGAPELSARLGTFADDRSAFAAVAASADLAIVPDPFLADGTTETVRSLRPGDVIEIGTAAGGHRSVTVAGVLASGFVRHGALVGPDLFAEVAPQAQARPTRYFVRADRGWTPNRLAAHLGADLAARGGEATTFVQIVDDEQAQTRGFLGLLQAYLAAGLVIGIAGLGVVLVRSGRERRREFATLRALGVGTGPIAWSFLVEAALVAVLASGIGVSLAVITAKRLVVDSTTFALVASRLAVPWARLSLVVGAAVVAALVAALVPAVSAARISAADALRRDD